MPEVRLAAPSIVTSRRKGPVLLSVPHSGRDVGPDLARRACGGAAALHALCDPYVDALVQPLFDRGFGGIVAMAPRAAIDVNRSTEDRDPMVHPDAPPPPPSSKAARGLGVVIGRRADGKPLWKEPLSQATFAHWRADAWDPYHDELKRVLAETRRREGIAILLDCHSMPPLSRGGARVVLGDRNGQSAAPWVADVAEGCLRAMGLPSARNFPYAGGEIARRHGDPESGVHVLQIEVDRTLYLDHAQRRPGSGMGRGRALFAALAEGMEQAAHRAPMRAAE